MTSNENDGTQWGHVTVESSIEADISHNLLSQNDDSRISVTEMIEEKHWILANRGGNVDRNSKLLLNIDLPAQP